MDIQSILTQLKPILLKLLVGAITLLIVKLSPKLGVPLTDSEIHTIAACGAATILGIGINWAAKTHATIAAAASAASDASKGSSS
jgi:hypothetical protein